MNAAVPVIFFVLGTSAFAVTPGGVLPVRPLVPEAEVGAVSSLVAPDGSVIINGNFTAVDGVARPGLARLTRTGLVDLGFRPGTIAAPGEATLPTFPLVTLAPNAGGSLLTAGGAVLYGSPGRLLAYRRDGGTDWRFEALHIPGEPLSPLFEDAGRLYFLRKAPDGQRVEAYRSDSLAPVALPGQDGWPVPPMQAVAAASGRLWVLGRTPRPQGAFLPDFSPYTLFRTLPDGAVDPLFTPVELSGASIHRLEPRTGGGYRLVSHNISYLYFWPSPTSLDYWIDRFSVDGDRDYADRITMPLSHSLILAEEPDGALIHNVARTWNEGEALVRRFPDGTRDPDFRIPLQGYALHRLDDGRLHHGHLYRSLPDGSPDPGWRVPRLTTEPTVRIVGRFDDGSILANLSTPSLVGERSQNPIVFDRDFRFDPAFRLPADLPPIQSFRRGADGQTIVAALRHAYAFPDGTSTRIVRLLRDGSIDPASSRYLPPSTTFFVSPVQDGGLQASPFSGDFAFHPLADGRFLVNYCVRGGDVDTRVVVRILPDGSPDASFQFDGMRFGCGGVTVLSDGSLVADNSLYTPDGALRQSLPHPGYSTVLAELPDGQLLLRCYVEGDYQLLKWHPDTGVDPAFSCVLPAGSSISAATPVGDGDIIVAGILLTATGRKEAVRLRADGRIDPTFRVPPAVRVLPRPWFLHTIVRGEERVPATLPNRTSQAQIGSLLYLPDQDVLLAAGNFTHLGWTPRRGLAMISLSHTTSYAEWAETTLAPQARDVSADPDDDGTPNLLEYLQGSDPAAADLAHGLRPIPGQPPMLRLPLNPDAKDVRPVIEASTDLLHWRSATDTELALDSQDSSHMQWRVPMDSPLLFLRVRAVERR